MAANNHTVGKASLLYVGISPKAPPKNGVKLSKQTMSEQIRYHYQGNAEGSTLRLTLGCLLSGELDIELRRVGSGRRMTFSEGEAVLSQWMADNAFVCWQQEDAPWLRERELIEELPLPLNLDGNKSNPFAAMVSGLRRSSWARSILLYVICFTTLTVNIPLCVSDSVRRRPGGVRSYARLGRWWRSVLPFN